MRGQETDAFEFDMLVFDSRVFDNMTLFVEVSFPETP